MKNFIDQILVLLSIALTASLLTISTAQADVAEDIEKVRAELIKMIPQASKAEISAAQVPGVYQVDLQGTFAYAYVSGDYILLGDLFNTQDQVNLGDQATAQRMASLIDAVPTSKMIVYGSEDAKRHITVFTDIDCGYCRKLHLEVPELNKAGIQVRYLAFPRAGIGSTSHKKYVSVWCNDDPQSSLTTAKSGGSVPSASCDNPIEESYNLGKQVGVRGTPTIIFDDGTVAPGYIPSKELIKRMGV
ncbi:MAG: thiol:disulfide interchange protein DsbC [Cryomorphaceae bacterium]|jgi:thiol:disulfide interchange protein DsbC